MATIEKTGVLTVSDGNGNKTVLYPVTKAEVVEGLENMSIGDAMMLGGVAAEDYATKEYVEESLVNVTPAPATVVDMTLFASGWENNLYTLIVPGVTESSTQDLVPATSINIAQLNALQMANIIDYAQYADTVVLKAMGTIPTIDIPIRVVVGVTAAPATFSGGGTGTASDDLFVGTRAELEALTEHEKLSIEMFVCTDDQTDDEGYASSEALNDILDGTTPVGDSSKLGGKSAESYIQSNPNLLTNGDFKLNTQGITSRSTDGYICDGWTADIEANTNVIWNDDGSVTIDLTNATYSGEIYQLVEAFTNDEMIMSAEINGVKYSVSGTNGNFSKYISVDGKTIAWLGCLITNGLLKYRLFAYAGYKVTFKNAKLEIGSVATPFTPTNTYEEYVKIYGTQHLSNPNLLINGDFRVNQRNGYYAPKGINCYADTKCTTLTGQLSTNYKATYYSDGVMYIGNNYYVKTSDCKKGYVGNKTKTVDGYFIDGNDLIVDVNSDNSLTLTNNTENWCSLCQKLEDTSLFNKTLTFSLIVDDVKYSVSGNVPTTKWSNIKTKINDNIAIYIQNAETYVNSVITIMNATCTIKEWKVELGSVATPLSLRPYGEELALCQRYLLSGSDVMNSGDVGLCGTLESWSTNAILFFVPTPCTMRTKPTLYGTADSQTNGYALYDPNGNIVTGFTFAVTTIMNNGLFVRALKTSHGLTPTNYKLRFYGNSGVSCEL